MPYSSVDLGKKVELETLKSILVKSAKEIGLKANIKAKYSENYKLGPVKKIKEYDWIDIILKGRLFKSMELTISSLTFGNSSFTVYYGPLWGTASQKKVEQYLEIVSKNL